MTSMNWPARSLRRLAAWSLALLLLGCGGGDPDSAGIGAQGGNVTASNGATLQVPAGALAGPVALAAVVSDAGAPPRPDAWLAAGEVLAVTPHGTRFAVPATVRLPWVPSRLPPGVQPALYKTGPDGRWQRVPGAVFEGAWVTAQVSELSWFGVGAEPPFIPASQQPQDVSADDGGSAGFSVTALGAPPFSYQWQRSDDGGSTWADLAGATQRELLLTGLRSAPAGSGGDDAARLRVIVRNPDGPTTSQSALLTVRPPVVAAPVISASPASLSVVAGADASFRVTATGSGLLLQWQRSSDGGSSFQDLAGETGAELHLSAVPLTDDGLQFRVVVRNAGGSVTSDAATLTVTPPGNGNGAAGARLAAGGEFSVAVLADGTVRSWGGGDGGSVLGAGAGIVSRPRPGPVSGLSGVVAVAAGPNSVLSLRANGEVWGWGNNTWCPLSTGVCVDAPLPVRYLGSPALGSVQGLAMGADHSLVLRADGRIEAAGWNVASVLGLPVYEQRQAAEVPGIGFVQQMSASETVSITVKQDGTVWSWGSNSLGQLGHGTTEPSNIPRRVVGIDPVQAVSAGRRHVLALARDGQLWAWGDGSNGKLGIGPLGPVSFRNVPHRVPLAGPFVAVAAGDEHSLALHADGTVFAWGINETGQLGSGSLSPGFSALPVRVAGLPAGVRAIAAGGGRGGLGHALALAPDGSVWAWGDNSAGQIGDGRPDRVRATPVVVPGLNLN